MGRLCGNHLQELYTLYLTRFRTYKNALPPQAKTQEGRGPQIDKNLPPNPFTGQFLRKDDPEGLVSLYLFGPWVGEQSTANTWNVCVHCLLTSNPGTGLKGGGGGDHGHLHLPRNGKLVRNFCQSSSVSQEAYTVPCTLYLDQLLVGCYINKI